MSHYRRVTSSKAAVYLSATLVLFTACTVASAQEAEKAPPAAARPILSDRGTGVPTSMFGTYIRGGEWLIYPFFERYRDNNAEYKPTEFGGSGEQDYRGRFHADEALFMVSHGLTDNIAFEIEAAVIHASFERAGDDPSRLPLAFSETGLGDVEGQLRWRWGRETASRPEFFSYGEAVVPHHRDKPLTGTPGWELKFGTGLIRGFRWGTITARGAVEYTSASSSHFDMGEYAVEYLKRVSPAWRLYVGLEGKQDEASVIGELQWHFSRRAFAKFNSGIGLTSKATDWAPEFGIVIAFPRERAHE